MREKILPPRLHAVAEFIREGASVCDVGTDHAFLPCYLARRGWDRLCATDINPNPLELARRYIEKRGLSDKIALIESDGLKRVPPCDDIVVAGMGGETIAGIVANMPFKSANTRLILQPMTKADELRRSLRESGFEIITEKRVTDGKRSYVIIYAGVKNMIKVNDVYSFLDEISPFNRQDKDDNSGLIVGSAEKQVQKIAVCLDVTRELAENTDADLIIAHHPIIYRPIKRIAEHDPFAALIKNDTAVIGFHTNHDVAAGGLTDLMLRRLGFPKSSGAMDAAGFGGITELDKAVTAKELAHACKKAFGCTVVKYVDGGKPIKRVGLCSGGGSMLVETANELNCDAYITGDIRWDRFVFAANAGLTLIDAGHFHTEDIFAEDLVARLSARFPELDIEKSEYSKDLCDYVT